MNITQIKILLLLSVFLLSLSACNEEKTPAGKMRGSNWKATEITQEDEVNLSGKNSSGGKMRGKKWDINIPEKEE